MLRKSGRVVSAVLLILLGAGGLQGLWNNLGTAESLFQHSISAGQLVLGVAGLAAGVGALFRQRWAGSAALVFALGMGYAAGAGPVAWGEVGWPRGLLDAALGFLIGAVLFFGIRVPAEESVVAGAE